MNLGHSAWPIPSGASAKKPGWGTTIAVAIAGVCVGFVGGLAGDSNSNDDNPEPQALVSAAPAPTMTVTATATTSVTATETVAVTETAVATETVVVTESAAAPAQQFARANGGTSNNSTEVYYANCREAKAAGAAPLYRGQPGYREKMDGDGDGVACES